MSNSSFTFLVVYVHAAIIIIPGLDLLILNYFQPTITHYFIRMLNDKGLLLRNYTQVQNMFPFTHIFWSRYRCV